VQLSWHPAGTVDPRAAAIRPRHNVALHCRLPSILTNLKRHTGPASQRPTDLQLGAHTPLTTDYAYANATIGPVPTTRGMLRPHCHSRCAQQDGHGLAEIAGGNLSGGPSCVLGITWTCLYTRCAVSNSATTAQVSAAAQGHQGVHMDNGDPSRGCWQVTPDLHMDRASSPRGGEGDCGRVCMCWLCTTA
jgi:hypothetical protein